MDSPVSPRVVLCDSLKAAFVEKFLFFFLLSTCFQSHFYGVHHFFRQPIRLRVIWWCLIRFIPYFSNHKLRYSSQNSGALTDTRVFGMPFLENRTLRICFIVELFLSGTQITSGHPEKDSTSINKSPTQVIYVWSICTRLHGSTFLGHECSLYKIS